MLFRSRLELLRRCAQPLGSLSPSSSDSRRATSAAFERTFALEELGAAAIVADGFDKHDFDTACRLFTIPDQCALRVEACGNDAAVVEDEEISRAQVFSKTREKIVAECACCAVHDEHAAGAALGWRLLRDQLFGQIVVELFDALCASILWRRWFSH